MENSIIEMLAGIPDQWRVFFLSMLPVTELRASIPLGIAWDMTAWSAFLWSIMGNFVPILPLLAVLKLLYKRMVDWPRLGKPLRKLAAVGDRKGEKVRRYGLAGLALLVAIPLPGTGVWTGCLVAVVLNIPYLKAVIAITVGMLIAGIAVTAIVSGGLMLSKLVYGELIIALAVIAIIVAVVVYKKKRKQKTN